ncbi:MAG: C39 family peptidase, partial [Paenibacillus macerans]|nr:C39 family peptidase [Paenibacillus macerans]
MKLVYYSQEDPRWKNVMYSITGDKKQTIGTSACGPTCASMAASSYTGKTILPTEAASFAVRNGFRTANSGTDWGFFRKFLGEYGLEIRQTSSLADVKAALKAGELAIASMGPGHTTGGGHYILLVGISKDGWIDVFDPNHDNRKYGNDGLIDQGVRDDGKVKAKEIVFAREAKQYWIISNPNQNQELEEKELDKAKVIANGKKID